MSDTVSGPTYTCAIRHTVTQPAYSGRAKYKIRKRTSHAILIVLILPTNMHWCYRPTGWEHHDSRRHTSHHIDTGCLSKQFGARTKRLTTYMASVARSSTVKFLANRHIVRAHNVTSMGSNLSISEMPTLSMSHKI